MKPLLSESQDDQSLRLLGRASLQIVHDLKNQINGLKLYATFLKKRLEKTERPVDELETVNKLISGLDRGAADLSLIGQFGHPVELKKQSDVDLKKIAQAVVNGLNETASGSGPLQTLIALDADNQTVVGAFDVESMTQSLTWITSAARKVAGSTVETNELQLKLTKDNGDAVVEWPIHDSSSHDPFRSLIGSDGLKMALAARIVEAHGGSAQRNNNRLQIRLPLNS